jgi:hypothetical protein
MKSSVHVAASAIFATTAFVSCQKKTDATNNAPQHSPVETRTEQKGEPTFYATTQYLDQGGDVFVFLRTEQILDKLPPFIEELSKLLQDAAANDPQGDPAQVAQWTKVVADAMDRTGIPHLRGFGLSVAQVKDGVSRTNTVLYSGERTKPGLLWDLAGNQPPRPLEALEILPATTIIASFSDFEIAQIWNYVKRTIDQLPEEQKAQISTQIDMAPMMLGVSIDELTAMMGKHVGFLVTADPSATMNVPMDGSTLAIPELAAAILFRVPDDKLYDFLNTKLDGMGGPKPLQNISEQGLRMRVADVPETGFPLRPALARFGNYVAIVTHEKLARQLARVGPENPPLLRDDPAFESLASLDSREVNSLAYMSPRAGEIIRKFQTAALEKEDTSQLPPALRKKIEDMYSWFQQDFHYQVGRLQSDGWVTHAYSDRGGETVVAAAAVAPTALMAAIAVPSFLRARARSQATTQENDLRFIDSAIDQFAIEHNLPVGTPVSPSQFTPYLKPGTDLHKRATAPGPFLDILGNPYPPFRVDELPKVPAATAAKLGEVADLEFWSPFPVEGE